MSARFALPRSRRPINTATNRARDIDANAHAQINHAMHTHLVLGQVADGLVAQGLEGLDGARRPR